MPRVTFIYPCVGRFPNTHYVRSWQMQPLSIAVLAALTPSDWEKAFYDDRIETIDYDSPTDLAAISIETYTARRGYQIAQEYRKRGVPVVIGGYHATFCPAEVLQNANAVCVGEAEPVWSDILQDTMVKKLSGVYSHPLSPDLKGIKADRTIFQDKNYFKIAMVETGRGCRFRCNFCSITAFYQATYRRRPVDEIIEELQQLKEKAVFFIDDNIIGDTKSARELFVALKPLGISWIGQASVNAADPKLVDLMAESGCVGLLIGFESLNSESLACMGKSVNQTMDYEQALHTLNQRGIRIYGAFMFGLQGDSTQSIGDTVRFAQKHKMFMAAFAHIVPFPGTPLYKTFEVEKKLIYDHWWLSRDYRFGQVHFYPASMTASQLEQYCHQARRDFFSLPSIFRRSLKPSANCSSFRMASLFFGLNLLLRREISQKRGLPLGIRKSTRDIITPKVSIEMAQSTDDSELRSLLQHMPMPGDVRLAYLREPSFYTALQVEGRYNEVIIGRDTNSGQVIGMGSRSVKTAFINGQPSPVGYLSSLRLLPEYRGSTNLAKGYRFFHNRHLDGRCRLYLTTILENNLLARNVLTSGRDGLPAYHDYGLYCCMAISLGQKPKPNHIEGLKIRPAKSDDVSAIIEFWHREGPKRQFFPQYTTDDLLAVEGLLRGLNLKNILLAYSGHKLVGTAAAWDQKAFRQSLVIDYSRKLSISRLPYNLAAWILGYPVLPHPGSYVNYLNLSLVCISNDDQNIFGALFAELLRRYHSSSSVLMAGFHQTDPLLPVLLKYRRFDYYSRLYIVCWEDGEADFANLDNRVPYLELGSL